MSNDGLYQVVVRTLHFIFRGLHHFRHRIGLRMKTSTKIIWIFESVLVVFLGFSLWFGKITEWTFMAVALAIILAVWDNKRVKISKEGIEIDEDSK